MSTIEKYGFFHNQDGVFELRNEPPRKWVNLHYNQIGEHEFYSEITNIGDGTTWVRDQKGCTCVLVGYDAKYLYIRDEESGTVFCPGGAPAATGVQDFSCKYSAAKTEICSTCEGLQVTQRVFVPKEETAEIWTVTIQNKTDRPRRISVFGYAMFQLTGCDHEGRDVEKDNYAEVLPEIGGVMVYNRNVHVPTDRFKGYLVALQHFAGGNGYRDHFLRSEFSTGTPRIIWGWNCDNRPGYGPDCAGIVQTTMEIAPNDVGRVDYLLGQAASVEDVLQLKNRLSEDKIDELCQQQMETEEKRASAFVVVPATPIWMH